MSFLIKAVKVSICEVCDGLGYVPLKDKKMSKTTKYTIEIGCKACGAKGRTSEDVELSEESLKDILK
tara:strand:- start:14 stop:214 length:201 start_codon:yes stop_codon:yes gene_type:complete